MHFRASLLSKVNSFLVILCIFLFFGNNNSYAIFLKNNRQNRPDLSQYKNDEILVKFKKDITFDKINSFSTSRGAEIIKEFPTIGVYHLRMKSKANPEKFLVSFRKNKMVEFAEPNYLRKAQRIPNDSYFFHQWGLHNEGQSGGTKDADIDAPEAWASNQGSGRILAAVIDSGVDYDHPDLAENIWWNNKEIPNNGLDDDGNGFIDDVRGWDFCNHDNAPYDDFSHGTHVAGIIGAEGNNELGVSGVNWDIKILPVKFLNSWGIGYDSDAIAAILYACEMGAGVINASWGGIGKSMALREVIRYSGECGVLFVAAAGNEAQDNGYFPSYPANYSLSNLISVAATDHNDGLASFSSFGKTTVDIAAPGHAVLSTIPVETGFGAIGVDSIYKLVYFSFGFEGISSNLAGDLVMAKVLERLEADIADGIILVDDDGGSSCETFYQETLDRLGFSYITIEVGDQEDGPSYSEGAENKVVIWLTGNTFKYTLTPKDQTEMARFLDHGGRLFLSGQDIGFDLIEMGNGPQFYRQYLHAIYLRDFYSHILAGVAGTSLEGLEFDIGPLGGGANNQKWPDVIAPADSYAVPLLLYKPYNFSSGTSMAAPFVSGAAAVVLAENPSMGPVDIKRTLMATADPVPNLAGKVISNGRLNIAEAIRGAPAASIRAEIISLIQEFTVGIGRGVIVKAMVMDDSGGLLSSPEVKATFSGEEADLVLFDDGLHNDDKPADGIYANVWHPKYTRPAVTITVTADQPPLIPGKDTIDGRITPGYSITPCSYYWIELEGIVPALNIPAGGYYYIDNLSLDINFYGQNYNGLSIGANGILWFEDINMYFDGLFVNSPIPSATIYEVERFVAPFWDYLNPSWKGNIYVGEFDSPNGKFLVIEWKDVAHVYSYSGISFEVIYWESTGEFIFQYKDVLLEDLPPYLGSYGITASIGIQDSPTNGLQFSFYQAALSNGLAVKFTPHDSLALIPTIKISTDKEAYIFRDIMFLQADLSNPGTLPYYADIYIALRLPGGKIYYLTNYGFSARPKARAYNVALVPGLNVLPITSLQFDSRFPVGTFTWYAGLAHPGTHNWIGEISTAQFYYSP